MELQLQAHPRELLMKKQATLPYVILAIALVAAALCVYVALNSSIRNGDSDANRYEAIKIDCEELYKTDLDRGVRFSGTPCDDIQLKQEFKAQYGYDY